MKIGGVGTTYGGRVESARAIRYMAVAAALAVASSCASGAVQPSGAVRELPTRWVASATDSTGYLQWTLTGSHVAGQLTYTYLQTSTSTAAQTDTAAFTGVVSRGDVTLTFPQGLGAIRSATGSITKSVLTLDVPDSTGAIQELTFRHGTINTYNGNVADLRQSAADNSAAAELPAPEPSATATTRSAAETLFAFWSAINHRNWQRVWSLGGSNLSNSYAAMVGGYSNTQHINGFIYQDDGRSAAVAVLAQETDGRTQLYRGAYSVTDGVIQSGSLSLQLTDGGRGFGAFAGDWGGHGRVLSVAPGGLAVMSLRTYVWCNETPTRRPCDAMDGNEILDGGLVAVRLASVSGNLAAGDVVWSTEPKISGAVTVTWVPAKDAIITSIFSGAYFCGAKAPGGLCGA